MFFYGITYTSKFEFWNLLPYYFFLYYIIGYTMLNFREKEKKLNFAS
jgi:hypothetical protein